MRKSLVIAAAIAAAASAGAVEVSWTQDPVAQAKPEITESMPKTLYAEALGSAVLEHAGRGWDEQVSLTVNNDGDRVGAEYTTCDPATEHSTENMPTCDYAEFVFPQLRVVGKTIVWNGTSIGEIKRGLFNSGVKLAKGVKLVAERRPAVIDRGFDRDHVTKVTVILRVTPVSR